MQIVNLASGKRDLKILFLIGKIINKAFVEADAWFKKPEYHLRFDQNGERMKQYISESDRSRILVAETDDKDKILVGAILLDWKNDVGHCTFNSVSICILKFYLGSANVYFFRGCTELSSNLCW